MDFNYFQKHDLFILFPSLVCLIISIVLYANAKDGKLWPAMLFLTVASLGLRVFMAHLDPFLWDWDERYHALVAKNLMLSPLKPTLYSHPVLPYDYTEWNKNYIWMHKQPLPLWQMALSFYLFGVNQFTARFPLVLEGALMTLIIYRIGSLTIKGQVGYLSALLYTVSFYALDFMTGGEALDHIDFALFFYVSASLWAWLEYRDSLKMKWVVLVGIFAGLAFMSKWVVGLLIFPVWGIVVLVQEREQFSSYLKIGIALLISALVFMPWQIYAYYRFPVEYKFEMNYNTQQHLFYSLGGHSGTIWYYFINLDHNYGYVTPYILLIALVLMWAFIKKGDAKIALFSFLLIPYTIFSSLAATKMPAFCYMASVPVFLALGSFAFFLQKFMKSILKKYSGITLSIFLIVTCWFSISLGEIAKIHTGYDPLNYYRINKVTFTDYFKKIGKTIPKDYIVFGLPYDVETDMMFYTGNICYQSFPHPNEYQELKKKGIKMAVILSGKIPAYLLNDPEVMKIKWL